MLRILTEASGSMTAAYLIKAIKECGNFAIASDVDTESVGRFLADDFIHMPAKNDPLLWNKVSLLLTSHNVDVVVPSFDEMLLGWAQRREELKGQGVHVILSNVDTMQTFQDKWLTYKFFVENDIPTPQTSLRQEHKVVKPRWGRGSKGFRITTTPQDMQGMISQELLSGQEYTVDVFCDQDHQPIYIVPRQRVRIHEGKSVEGMAVYQPEVINLATKICQRIPFVGPINMQCFLCDDGIVRFLEINPRIAGGMALGFAATENWIKLIVDHFIYGKSIRAKEISYGLKMRRYYAEVFIP